MIELRNILVEVVDQKTAYNSEAWEQSKSICPLSEHCFAVAYVVQQLFGGEILCGRIKGERHAWNQLPNGTEIDLTGSQYGGDGMHPVCQGKKWNQPQNTNPRFKLLLERVKNTIIKS